MVVYPLECYAISNSFYAFTFEVVKTNTASSNMKIELAFGATESGRSLDGNTENLAIRV